MRDGGVKSAGRVLDLFELFEAEQRALKISEIVSALNLPQSSVSMLVKTMRDRGFIDFDPVTRTYRPSVRLAFLGSWAAGPVGTSDQIRAQMRALGETTGESIVLGRLIGYHMQYLSVIESKHALRFTLHPGMIRLSFRAGLGIAILATRADDEIRRLATRYNAERSEDDAPVSEAWVAEQIAVARQQGFYQSVGTTTPGVGVIAMALATAVRGQNLGLGIGGPLPRLEEHRAQLVASLRATIAALA